MSQQQPQPELMSLGVLQHSANRFIRLAEVDSGRLAQHRANLSRMRLAEAPDGPGGQLNRELVNASRCVRQLKCRLLELHQLQGHVQPADRPAFDLLVGPTVAMVTEQIHDFAEAYLDVTMSLDAGGKCGGAYSAEDLRGPQQLTPAQRASYVFDDSPALPTSTSALALEEATTNLARDLADLEELMSQLSATVTAQGAGVASVEASIACAEAEAEAGVHWLRRAVRYQAFYLPVAGAATGALLGGPVGLLIGLKAGAAAGLLGGVAGYAGGRLFAFGSSAAAEAAPVESANSMEMKPLAPAPQSSSAAPAQEPPS